jgi:hypothetical protein
MAKSRIQKRGGRRRRRSQILGKGMGRFPGYCPISLDAPRERERKRKSKREERERRRRRMRRRRGTSRES